MRLLCTAALSCAVLFNAAAAHADNLVTNGGFETGNFSGFTTTAASRGSDFGVFPAHPHSGSYAAYFGGTDAGYYDLISQSLNTVAGGTYNVSFWFDITGANTASSAQGSPNKQIQVIWDGTVVFSTSAPTNGYNQMSLLETATGNDTLGFRAFDVTSNIFLDDIRVSTVSTPVTSPVPEPSSLALLGTGLVGAVAAVRRRLAR